MTSKSFRRAHLRAPLMTSVLYVDDDYVHRCRSLNISKGGILLGELPHIPEINALPIMFALPEIPLFSKLLHHEILALNEDQFHVDIVRVKARMVRQFDKKQRLDAIFTKNIGCEFVKASEQTKDKIELYVQKMAKNTVFLLSLFENKAKTETNLKVIRRVSRLLGYNEEEKLSLLRLKVLHDYQSLESL